MEQTPTTSEQPADQVSQVQAEEITTPPTSAQPDAALPKPDSPLYHQAPPAAVGESWSKKTLFLTSLAVALVVGLIGGGLVISQRAFAPKPPSSPSPTLELKSTPEPTPVATQSATLTPADLADYSVQILNGSGGVGEAGRIEALLKAEGFLKIKTGNAENFDYEETEIHLAQGLNDQLFWIVEQALDDQFTVTRSPTLMTDQAEYDMVIIVGQKKE